MTTSGCILSTSGIQWNAPVICDSHPASCVVYYYSGLQVMPKYLSVSIENQANIGLVPLLLADGNLAMTPGDQCSNIGMSDRMICPVVYI